MRSGIFVFLFTALSFCPAVLGQNPPAPNPAVFQKGIAVLSFNNAVMATAEARSDMNALQVKFASREQDLKKLNDDVEALRKDLSETSKHTESERNRESADLIRKEKQLERGSEDYKNDIQTESQQLYQRVAQKMYSFLQDYAHQHAYVAVLDRGTDEAPLVWYATSDLDITGKIVEAYDQRSGGGTHSLPNKPVPSGNRK